MMTMVVVVVVVRSRLRDDVLLCLDKGSVGGVLADAVREVELRL